MDQWDARSELPIAYYLQHINYTGNQFNYELFRKFLPQRSRGGEILRPIICHIFENKQFDNNETCLFETFQQLLQRLHFDEPLEVDVILDGGIGYVDIDNILVAEICDNRSVYSAYIGCRILVELRLIWFQ